MGGKLVPMDPAETGGAYAFDSGRVDDFPKLGEFYWIEETRENVSDYSMDSYPYFEEGEDGEEKKTVWFGCVVEIGSNYVEFHSPSLSSGYLTERVHFDDIERMCRREPEPEKFIADMVAHYQGELNTLLGHIKEETRKLGVVPTGDAIEHHSEGQNALVAVSQQVDTTAYKNALIKAKDVTLPDLFKQVEKANKKLAGWMTANILPMQAEIGPMKDGIKAINDRIYTISIYAGLTEDAVKVKDGDPAKMSEKLRVMQRRLYMDEECLANYYAGGMEFKDISKFDEWLSIPENFERILPFQRCMVAFRVRRESKEREDNGDMGQVMINISLREADKSTFLYIRNGEQMWRIDADIDFGPMIFPDKDEFDPSQPMYAKLFAGKIDKMIPKSAYDVMMEERAALKVKDDEWKKNHPKSEHWRSPHDGWMRDSTFDRYVEVNPSSVYYDDAMEFIGDQIKHYNRIAVIMQGLFDRSPVLHPHPRVVLWDPVSFASSAELIYDNMTLTYSDPPDFEAYMAELAETIGEGTIVTGQEDYWMRQEAIRENKRQENDWRRDRRSTSNYTRYRPYDDPGPGFVAEIKEWRPRAKKAVFRWQVETSWDTRWKGGNDYKPRSVEVPVAKLFNVSAYKPGDYKRFLSDTRTRRQYLKWAPLLLAAEDYHAGKLKMGGSSESGSTWNW